MTFDLVVEVVEKTTNEGEKIVFNNFYLYDTEHLGIKLPIEIKKFKDDQGHIKNKSDYFLATRFAHYVKSTNKN